MDGNEAVRIARKTIDLWVKERKRYSPGKHSKDFDEKRGVFVTLHIHPGKELRGCIGFPEPVYPFLRGLQEAAIAAATQDPRFDPVTEPELDKFIVEVSILTRPEPIKVRDRMKCAKSICVGRDGLIVRNGFRSGLLLPQVAEEYGWDAEEFLQHTCVKACLTPDMWLDEGTEIYTFQAHVFSEKKPGEV